ncbi:MAG: hypothetical protein HYS18_11570 [Burkholderiales bacterium]|nr:hypothetical protein [Burkholderiales bacterium]
MKVRQSNFRFSLILLLALGGCAGPRIEQKELAAMDAHQVIHILAKERPIQVAWRERVIDSIQRVETANFLAYQIHYVATGLSSDGKDITAAKFVKSYCEARGGIYPDKTFGSTNPHGLRTDCMSLASGKLLFSVYTVTSPKFPLTMGGATNYNVVAIASPKTPLDIDPNMELRMVQRDLPHNYQSRGTFNMLSLESK